MLQDIKSIYTSAWAFALACPILFFIPVAAEMAQHIAEIHIGLYQSYDMAKDVAESETRLRFGIVKVIFLLLPSYWFIRYLGYGHSAKEARRFNTRGFRLWLVVLALHAGLSVFALLGPPLADIFGFTGTLGEWFDTGVNIAWTLFSIYLIAWFVAWPLGNAAIGPGRSIGVMNGHFWRAVLYSLAGFLPLMIAHSALGIGAIGRPDWLVWVMMVIDSALVGILALTMAGAAWFAAKRAAESKGISLLPERQTSAS